MREDFLGMCFWLLVSYFAMIFEVIASVGLRAQLTLKI